MWDRFQSGHEFDRGLTKWRDVFALLRDIRPWGVADRIEETGVLEDWTVRVRENAEQVHCEIELWFRASLERRETASQAVRARVQELGGEVLNEAVVAGIHYHGLAVRLPIRAVQRIISQETRNQIQLVRSEQIQFFRPAGQMVVPSLVDRTPSTTTFTGALPSGPARVALLDGLPLQNHSALANRLDVDDPDGFETDYPAHARAHGTSMASLIIWGDLNDTNRSPIPQPLYVRPIMRPVLPPAWTQRQPYELVPEGILIVDLVHRAVRRLFESEGGTEAIASDVALVNFSIGAPDRPFTKTLSPLARLIDWLSWTYGTLFVVSAGNHLHEVDTGRPWSELESLTQEELTAVIVQSVAADTRNRRALSPAEAMNALTVGALHDDRDTAAMPATRIDPVPAGYPSPLSAHGLGYRRSIKPDLLVQGGRLQFERPIPSHDTQLRPVRVAASPGLQVAAPGVLAGDLTHTTKSRGTSNATALLSRTGAFLAPLLRNLRLEAGTTVLANVPDGVLLKTLLAHGARWGKLGSALLGHFASIGSSDKRTEQVTRLLGFGRLEFDVAECLATRVTGIGGGTLAMNTGAEHRFPLPPSLSGWRGWRRLTVTLGWFTPVNPLSYKWRKAHLWFEAPKSKLKLGRVGPDWKTAQRGTLQHDTFEGESAVAFLDGEDIVVRVSCREDAPGLDGAVPYAIAVTLEVAEGIGIGIGIDIYAEVRERVRQRLRVPASGTP